MTDPILPNHPEHKHNALYDHLVEQVRSAAPDQPSVGRANLAANLLHAYLRNQSNPELRLDETRIRDLRVVPGNTDAPTPSLFLVSASQKPNPASERISVPLATADEPASQTLARYGQRRSVGADGYLTDPGIIQTAIPSLQRAPMNDVNAIVLHRTAGSTADGTLNHWRNTPRPSGTHFIIDKDGSIHQTSRLERHTNHVGAIQSRGENEGTLTAQEQQQINQARAANPSDKDNASAVHRIERTRAYPDRYPTNLDSIGIEVVGAFNRQTQAWDAATPEQTASIRRLVGILQNNYGLNDHDVYEHDRISYKTRGEGAGLYRSGADHVLDPGMQQPTGPSR